jgi:hypothetical protein
MYMYNMDTVRRDGMCGVRVRDASGQRNLNISKKAPTNTQLISLHNCLPTCFEPFGSSSGLYRIPKIIE